jgi:hypothetical protein
MLFSWDLITPLFSGVADGCKPVLDYNPEPDYNPELDYVPDQPDLYVAKDYGQAGLHCHFKEKVNFDTTGGIQRPALHCRQGPHLRHNLRGEHS